MFSRFFSITLFIAAALAQIDPGVYRITNFAIGGSVHAYHLLDYVLYISPDGGLSSQWKLEPGQEPRSFTFQNVAFGYYATAIYNVWVYNELNATSFDVHHDGEGKYTIKELNENSVWTSEYLDGGYPGYVGLAPATGNQTQIWGFTAVKTED